MIVREVASQEVSSVLQRKESPTHTGALRMFDPVPLPLLILCILIAAAGVLSANAVLTVACAATLFVVSLLLFRRGEPPALLLVAMLQWAQVATKVFHADAHGQT